MQIQNLIKIEWHGFKEEIPLSDILVSILLIALAYFAINYDLSLVNDCYKKIEECYTSLGIWHKNLTIPKNFSINNTVFNTTNN